MSNTEPTASGQSIGGLDAPGDFGEDLAAIFAARDTRSFDQDASRADMGGGSSLDVPPGGWPGGDTVDASQGVTGPASAAVGSGDGGVVPAVTPAIPANPADLPAGSELPPPSTAPASTDAPVVDPLPAPVVDGLPGGGSAEGPASPAVDPSATVEPEPAADGWVYNYTTQDGQQAAQRFTDQEVERALMVSAWADNLPDATRAAMGAIEEGQAVAIPRADFDRYQAWLGQQQNTQRDADLVNYDEDAAALIKAARDERDALARQQQQAPAQQQSVATSNPNIDANLNATAQAYDQAAQQYRDAHGLDQADLEALLDSVGQAQIIGGLQQAHTQFNPVTGQIIRPADPRVVLSKALDAALTWNPALHNKVLTHAATTAATTPTPSTTPVPHVDPVTTKKANAASLASAPSAAVPPSPRTGALTGQEAVNAMAADLLAFMSE